MPATFAPLSSTVLTGNQATVSFGSIPAGYTDIVFLMSVRTDRVTYIDYFYTTINSATTNYSETTLSSYDVTVTTNRFNTQPQFVTNVGVDSAGNTANAFTSIEFYLPNYSGNTAKAAALMAVAENNTTTYEWTNTLGAHLWNDTTAISSITFRPAYGSNFVSGSRFDLYGILKA